MKKKKAILTLRETVMERESTIVPEKVQSWPKTMWTVAFDQLFKQKCKIYRSFFNPPAPLNNVVLQYVV